MRILAFETSAKAASVALLEGDMLLGELYLNCGLTHSRTLLESAQRLLEITELTAKDIDAVACAAGPGSFTGVRIGVAAAKGFAWGRDIPCCGVSTLEAMAWQASEFSGIVCCAMDARRSQVYHTRFLAENGTLTRLCPDCAVSLDEVRLALENCEKPKIMVGDGAQLCYNTFGACLRRSIGECSALQVWRSLRGGSSVKGRIAAARRSRRIICVCLRQSGNVRSACAHRRRVSMGKVQVLDHPLLQHKLSILRDKNTGVKEFREIVGEIAALMCYEATRNLPTEEVEIETPVAMAKTKVLSGKKLAIVPILRAGLGMVDSMIELIPSAKVGHIGLFRDPETHEPVKYYCKMPPDISERQVFVVDPMLATGGSAVAALDILKKEYGCRYLTLMDIIAAPEGVKAVTEAHPDVDLYVAAVDDHLNEHAYIVPGLGDAGDRIFGTK